MRCGRCVWEQRTGVNSEKRVTDARSHAMTKLLVSFTWWGGGGLSGCTLQHSQRGLDSTVHIVLKDKREQAFQNHLTDALT